MVMAHPDDEIIFGWPILQNKSYKKALLVCSTDRTNKERAWCSHRREILLELCSEFNIRCYCLDNDSEFYRYETRSGTFSKTCAQITEKIISINPGKIFTHNPMGEYGHLDHMLVHNLVLRAVSPETEILITDTFIPSNWTYQYRISDKQKDIFYKNKLMSCVLEEDIYAHWKNKYEQANCWTWSKPPIYNCSVYVI